ncbi:MBL fold metallo-hydrolase [Thermoflavimicrobium daqui]|uniref:Hydrolase glyoxylase n=1 Tax=Thermoflavimicrobium daqui TaxID=2137476 RepID=A0A364K7N1_9BACL|nr:MBL fold metallo-hydrolase [Thermoflavimicrobium daqui]RAL26306.1 hydrolase glyoxylase [Thermoflavimicrobium daqui]
MTTEDLVLVVDPTWLPDEVLAIQREVEQIRQGREVYLLFTHHDFDHILGYGAFSDAKVIGNHLTATLSDEVKQTAIQQIHAFDQKYYLKRNYPVTFPRFDYKISRDGEVIQVGQTQLTFYLAPGHTLDGLFCIVEPLGIFIAGDYLSNIEFPYIYHSSEAYEQTLHKIKLVLNNHDIRLLIPGHGQVTSSQAEMIQRKDQGLEYIRNLRDAVAHHNLAWLEKYFAQYPFPLGMKPFHEENIKLVQKELQKEGE